MLPYLEENATYDSLDLKGAIHQPVQNFRAGAKRVDAYLCPSDIKGWELISCCSAQTNGGKNEEDWSKTNMAGVADSRDWTCNTQKSYARRDADGVMFQVSNLPISKITDGSSHTLMVGEVVGSLGSVDNFGFYWVTWDILHTVNGVNLASRIEPIQANSVEEGSFASFHPGGCHFVFCDGHATFVGEDIDQVTLASITTRAGEEVLDDGY